MSTFRTLSERRYTDPSLHNLRWNRSLRDAGWPDEINEDDSYHPEYCVVYLFAAIVFAIVGAIWLMR